MKVILIAAGMGTRLRPMTQDLPKCLAISSGGRTLFDEQIDAFHACGFKDIVVIRGYQGEKFTRTGVRYVWNHDFERNNILGSLMKAAHEFDDDLIVSYSDIWFEPGIPAALARAEGGMVIAVDPGWKQAYEGRVDHPLAEAEIVEMTADGFVRKIGKISNEGTEIHGEFIGMLKFSRAAAQLFKKSYEEAAKSYAGRPFQRAAVFEKAYVTDMLQYLTGKGIPVKCQAIAGSWREIDTLEDFRNLEALWKQRRK